MQVTKLVRQRRRALTVPKTSKKKWKRFEDLATHIQRTLAPGATVEQNVRVMGRRSGVEREIDIVVRMKAGQYNLFVAIDCKDYKRNVDVLGSADEL